MNPIFQQSLFFLLLLSVLHEGNCGGILNCPFISSSSSQVVLESGIYKNQNESIKCLLSIPKNITTVKCQQIQHDEIHVFRVIGDYQYLNINCSSTTFNLFVDYDGQQPTEALSLNYFKNVNVSQKTKGEPNISLNSFGLTVTVTSIQKLFQDYLNQRDLYKKQGYENEYFHKTRLLSPILYPRTGKITIRGKGQYFENEESSLQFYFFFEEPEIRGSVSWIKSKETRRPRVIDQWILVPCRPSHYVNHVKISMSSHSDGQDLKFEQNLNVNVTFDPILGFKIPLTDLRDNNLEDIQFKCSLQMAQGETWTQLFGEPPIGKVPGTVLYGLGLLNVTKETDAFSVNHEVVENQVTDGDLFCTLRCTFNDIPQQTAGFFSYGRQIKAAEEFKFRRELVLPIFAHLSYYVQSGVRLNGSRDFVISREGTFGITFCTSGSTYKYQEYTVGLNKFKYALPNVAPWSDLPYEKIRWPSVFIQLHVGGLDAKHQPKEIYAGEKVTFVCKILKHVMVAPVLWFTRTKENVTNLILKDDDFTDDVSYLTTTFSINVKKIMCSSSIWTSKDLWHVASTNLTIQLKIAEDIPDSSASSDLVPIMIGLAAGLIFCLCLILLLYWRFRTLSSKKIFSMTEINEFRNGVSSESNEYSLPLAQPYAEEYEIPEDQFQINKNEVLGSGEYGIVLKGQVKGQPVAVKTIKDEDGTISKDHVKALLSEIKIMGYLGSHPNLINLIGASTINLRRGIVYVFVEFCEQGNLLNYLQNNKQKFLDSTYTNMNQVSVDISTSLLVRWALEIARGMEFLAGKKVIHGDLAARNVLLTADRIAKITDFGLSRQLDNYSLYMKKSQNPLPWRWLAVESLSELQFSCESDVWAYGVVLWEMYSLGAIPYPNMAWTNDFVQSLVQGHRLDCPALMSSQMYQELVLPCWNFQPNQRPDFNAIISFLEQNQAANLF